MVNLLYQRHYFRHVCDVIATLILILTPGLIALDCGGHLPWSYWLLSLLAIAVVVLVSLGQCSGQHRPVENPPFVTATYGSIVLYQAKCLFERFVRWSPLWVVGFITAQAFVQTLPMPASVARQWSPNTAEAFEVWLPIAIGELPPEQFPMSISRWLTESFAARSLLLVAFAYAGGLLFSKREFVRLLLIGLVFAAVLQSFAGFYQQSVSPDIYLFGEQRIGRPFGTFVNRNNAGALLNLGLAAAIGLVTSQLHTQRGIVNPRDSKRPGFKQALMTIANVRLAVTVLSALIIFAALLAAGSRGALLGAVVGLAACLLTMVSLRQLPVALLGLVIVVLVSLAILARSELPATAIERITSDRELSLESESRLAHWLDSLRTASASLPFGSGLGAYRYAYLPHQETGGAGWHHNADNLWLEWLVEAGIATPGILALAFVGSVLSLRRLHRAKSPLDRGLSMAGLFALAAIGTSQSFDAALTLSSIAIAATLLASAVHARQAGLADQWSSAIAEFILRRPRHQALLVARISALGILIVALIFAQKHHLIATNADSLARRVRFSLDDASATYPMLVDLYDEVKKSLAIAPQCDPLWTAKASLDQRRFRIERTNLLVSQQGLELSQASARTAIDQLRQYPIQSDQGRAKNAMLGNPPLAQDPWLQEAIRASQTQLKQNPLCVTCRLNLIRLDFSDGAQDRLPPLLDQVTELRSQHPPTLTYVMQIAAETQNWQSLLLAVQKYVRLKPNNLSEINDYLRQAADVISLQQILPSDWQNPAHRQLILDAARLQSQWPADQQDAEIKARARQLLNPPINASERSLLEQLQ